MLLQQAHAVRLLARARLDGTLRRYDERALGAGWHELPEMKKLLHDAHRGNMKRPSEAASADLMAFVAYYEHHVAQSQRNKVIDAQGAPSVNVEAKPVAAPATTNMKKSAFRI